MISTDNASTWNPGSLGAVGFEASSPSIGLAVFRVGDLDGFDSTCTSAGLRLFYGSKDDHLVHELVSPLDSNDWSAGFTFPSSNGHAGMASNYADAYGHASLYLLDEHNQIRVWSHAYNTTVSAGNDACTSFAPMGSWTQGTLSFLSSRPSRRFLSSSGVSPSSWSQIPPQLPLHRPSAPIPP